MDRKSRRFNLSDLLSLLIRITTDTIKLFVLKITGQTSVRLNWENYTKRTPCFTAKWNLFWPHEWLQTPRFKKSLFVRSYLKTNNVMLSVLIFMKSWMSKEWILKFKWRLFRSTTMVNMIFETFIRGELSALNWYQERKFREDSDEYIHIQ